MGHFSLGTIHLVCTLESRIRVHARLLNFDPFFPNHGLIRDCTFIYFWPKIPPARLLRACTILVWNPLTKIPPCTMILGMHNFCTGPNPPGTYMILRPCMIFVNQSPYTIIEKYFLWSKKVGRPKAKCLLTSRKISSCDITLFLQSQRNFPFSPTIVFNK